MSEDESELLDSPTLSEVLLSASRIFRSKGMNYDPHKIGISPYGRHERLVVVHLIEDSESR